MKTLPVFCSALVMLSSLAHAIPQTFSQAQNIFLRTTGVSFEEFATDPTTWDGNGDLKGHWETQGNTSSLVDTAAVFGIAADQVTSQQQDGRVQSIRVLFRANPKTGGSKRTDLMRQVRANLQAFTSDSGTNTSAGAVTYRYKAVTITLRPAQGGDVVVEFTRG